MNSFQLYKTYENIEVYCFCRSVANIISCCCSCSECRSTLHIFGPYNKFHGHCLLYVLVPLVPVVVFLFLFFDLQILPFDGTKVWQSHIRFAWRQLWCWCSGYYGNGWPEEALHTRLLHAHNLRSYWIRYWQTRILEMIVRVTYSKCTFFGCINCNVVELLVPNIGTFFQRFAMLGSVLR